MSSSIQFEYGLYDSAIQPGIALDLIIPTLNEEHRIGSTLRAISDRIRTDHLPIRIIVVDNGSVDRTVEVVNSYRNQDVPLALINCRTRGKGAAVRTGVQYASAPRVGYCDADLPVPAQALKQVIQLLDAGWEIVVGSRRCEGAEYAVPQPTVRRLGSRVFRALSSDLRGSLSDTQCGFKFFTSNIANQLFNDSRVDGFAFDLEILARAQYLGARLIELPVTWSDKGGSSFRAVADGIQSIIDLRSTRRRLRGELVTTDKRY